MIKINLLPHREAKRKERINAFYAMLLMSGMFGVAMAFAVWGFFENQISSQNERNNFIKAENARLDKEIEKIASLKQEIEALKARQQAVEDLQSDRNQPVHLMDELVKQVPEGIYLKSFKQTGQQVVLNGLAQSNERVSELLRNLNNHSEWLERPDLVEIRSTSVGKEKNAKTVFDFTLNVGIKRPTQKDEPASGKPVKNNLQASGVAAAAKS
jgi:type IV pilus assembly protein PilN